MAMTWQASRLRRCLAGRVEWREVALEFPEVQLALAELAALNLPNLQQSVIQLYRKHVADWFNFSALQHLPMRVAA